ncbi:1-aminocyclopropane-1-carboxylate deaminase/D-cysteine desulfhydrase [Agaribacterium haliotis]|uniref:1-aminocyclopropane-1-carboxylate deaminase/D-cysteine desulfhydrase n=1 Tax=Agaribacterium haliotis TaxID=2013869 RepID=UPI000BB53338|nr:pyridoxal-phosphate dependent enzyme [Agaribacterium haliotis]
MLQQVPGAAQAQPIKTREQLIAFLGNKYASIDTLTNSVVHQRLSWSVAKRAGLELYVRRDDLIDADLSGNKLYKLYGYLRHHQYNSPAAPVLSFGGAYSNHLHALACLGQLLGLNCHAIIRGQRPKQMSPTLVDLEARGMRLHFVSREAYRRRSEPAYVCSLLKQLALPETSLVIPEGGDGELGLIGMRSIGRHLANQGWQHTVISAGTGTSFLGLAQGVAEALAKHSSISALAQAQIPQLWAVSALAAGDSIASKLRAALAGRRLSWACSNQWHAGGFAKLKPELSAFKCCFESETALALDRVYTLKLFWALKHWIEAGLYRPGQRLLAIHTGGLQGNRSLVE